MCVGMLEKGLVSLAGNDQKKTFSTGRDHAQTKMNTHTHEGIHD